MTYLVSLFKTFLGGGNPLLRPHPPRHFVPHFSGPSAPQFYRPPYLIVCNSTTADDELLSAGTDSLPYYTLTNFTVWLTCHDRGCDQLRLRRCIASHTVHSTMVTIPFLLQLPYSVEQPSTSGDVIAVAYSLLAPFKDGTIYLDVWLRTCEIYL